ncbi:sigma-70 family RNA polymerase sigma factor [Kribbella sandramycini]|uniref:RNA polymerase sigma-70 factor (ECF subfamily) n=1 Tax=Kribbella sandramycini TaxID=60450 RepID=A0A7Y4KVS4_9ACTN|nr:sigma-70 family RNA polymerase sigma factor [Kribbella sandramycini]MBB6567774.1 RNA polymerase sigma-70 factor (ECF subfamily) [Kribbella sandramycini]NOL39630.1 sigma-70 family RNA polymerase sigma factor [Kribbella sandramycini]
MEQIALDEAAEIFTQARRRLFGIAYRMLGTVSDAEDLLQEVWLRWQAADRTTVHNPIAYLSTTTSRLAINATKTAYARHETYAGPWLPEPVDTSADPQLGAERGAALELAVLMLMEKLPPHERAAYVLREAFDYPYREIAEIIRTTEATARQWVTRARKHLAEDRRAPVAPSERQRLLNGFLAAAQAGDIAGLEELLADEVVSYSDSGGTSSNAARVPLYGAATVAAAVVGFASKVWRDVSAEPVTVNGQYALRLRQQGAVFAVLSIDASDDGITQVLWQVNPAKIEGAGSWT